MANSNFSTNKKWSRNELRIFKKKDMRILIEVLIKADGIRNEGTGKKMNRIEIKADLKWALELEDEMVDAIISEEDKKVVEANEKMKRTDPFHKEITTHHN